MIRPRLRWLTGLTPLAAVVSFNAWYLRGPALAGLFVTDRRGRRRTSLP